METALEEELPAKVALPSPKVAFSVRDVAALLGIHRNTVYAQIKRGSIPVIYMGTKPLVPRRWLEETFGLSGS